jgi:threonylcarbamoyladenosine tRNA methylthiotransferase MtaB
LRALCERKQYAFVRQFDGALAEMLVERTRDPRSGLLRGYTRNYTRVLLSGSETLVGRRVAVRLAAGERAVMRGMLAA